MSAPVPLLTLPEALQAARDLCATADGSPDARRAITGLSTSAVLSVAILARQLDRIARAAAVFATRSKDIEAWSDLQEQLLAAGYLPLPEQKDNIHGEG